MNRIPVPDFFLHGNALHSLSCYEDDTITNASTSSVTLEEEKEVRRGEYHVL